MLMQNAPARFRLRAIKTYRGIYALKLLMYEVNP